MPQRPAASFTEGDDFPVDHRPPAQCPSRGLELREGSTTSRIELRGLREFLGEDASRGVLRLSAQSEVRDAAHVDELFDQARARANEGLVIKEPRSVYTPGRRGKSWLKYKKALATIDCVVTYAQWGNGKRKNVLSDLTFGILREGEVVNVGKAYDEISTIDDVRRIYEGQLHREAQRGRSTFVSSRTRAQRAEGPASTLDESSSLPSLRSGSG